MTKTELIARQSLKIANLEQEIEQYRIGTAPVIPIDNPYYFFGNLDKAVGELKYETHRITHGGDRCLETITCGELDVVMESVKEAIRQLKRVKMPEDEKYPYKTA